MKYAEHAVGGAAARFVQCIWSLNGDGLDPAATADPILPDGCIELLLDTGDPVDRHSAAGIERQPRRQVAGQLTTAVRIKPTGRLGVVGVRLHPWAAGAFLRVPMHALRDRMLPADDLRVAKELLRDASNGESADERMRLLRCAIERHALMLAAPAPAAVVMTSQLMRGPSTPGIRAMADGIGLTTRRVQAIFAEHVGLSPKALSRIARLQRALAYARSRPHRPLSAVAHDSGYYDQAHFIRDCRDIAGETPSHVLGRTDDVTTAFLSA
jgi:AraC-like DNA-binding protein